MTDTFPRVFVRTSHIYPSRHPFPSLNRWCFVWRATHPAVGRDEASDADQPSISKKPGHLSSASNVLFTVLWAEAEVFVQPLANVVPIQCVAGDTVTHQVLLQSHAHRGLPCTRQTLAQKKTDVMRWHTCAEGTPYWTFVNQSCWHLIAYHSATRCILWTLLLCQQPARACFGWHDELDRWHWLHVAFPEIKKKDLLSIQPT